MSNIDAEKLIMAKVIKTTDCKFAIVERTQVNRSIAIWSPVDERRWNSESDARFALFQLRTIGKIPPIAEEKPKVTIDRSHLPLRSQLRVTKLEKGVFVVECYKLGKWVKVKTCKTSTKAEEWCAINSRS